MIRIRCRLFALLTAAAIILGLTTVGPNAGASTWWLYSDRRWPAGARPYALGNLSYFNGGGVVVGVSTLAVERWDFVNTSSWDVQYVGADFSQNWPGNCVLTNYWVYQDDLVARGIGSEVLGRTATCAAGSAPYLQLFSANTRMNSWARLSTIGAMTSTAF